VEIQLIQKVTFFLCVPMLAFAPLVHSQDQSTTAPQSGTTSPKAKPKVEEPEAGTNEGTEALQKATQNPVASLISVPVQNNNNFGVNPGYRNQARHTHWHFQRLEPHHPLDYSDHLSAIAQPAGNS
jgi:hypothetical protein